MIVQPASLPIVVLFERHWDVKPREVLKYLIPKLAEIGYNTLCLEVPHCDSETKIICSFRENQKGFLKLRKTAESYLTKAQVKHGELSEIPFDVLAILMHQYVASQYYETVTERIKLIPSQKILLESFDIALTRSWSVAGVDIYGLDYILGHKISERSDLINPREEQRITTIADNLLRLSKSGHGVLFVGGALHAENLINHFRAKNLSERVVYVFPHSNKSYAEQIDDIKVYFSPNILKGHQFCVTDEKDVQSVSQKVVDEVEAKNIYYSSELIGGNIHSDSLEALFKTHFKAFLRPGHYVDALLDETQANHVEVIRERLTEAHIPSYKTGISGTNFLVIPKINTRGVAERIQSLAAFNRLVDAVD